MLYNVMDQFVKNVHNIMHQMVLLKEENIKFHEMNWIFSQCCKTKKT